VKRHPCSWSQRLNIVKIVTLLKVIYRFNVMSINIPKVVSFCLLFGLVWLRQNLLCCHNWPHTHYVVQDILKCWVYRHAPQGLPRVFLTERKNNLKTHTGSQEMPNRHTIMKKKNKVRGLILHDFKTYHKS
jgi:hypothetical protein